MGWQKSISTVVVGLLLASCSQPRLTGAYELIDDVTIDSGNSAYFSIINLDWNPNNDLIAIAAHTDTYVYDVNLKEAFHLRDEPGVGGTVAWNSTGEYLAGTATTLWLWDADQNTIITNVQTDSDYFHYQGVVWSLDESTVVSGYFDATGSHNKSALVTWNFEKNETVMLSEDDALFPVTWLKDGHHLIVTAETGVSILEPDSNSSFQLKTGETLASPPLHLSNNGEFLVTSTAVNQIAVWNTSDWGLAKPVYYPELGQITDIQWHPRDSRLAVATENGVWIRDIADDSISLVNDEPSKAVAWNADGTQLATASREGHLSIWSIDTLP